MSDGGEDVPGGFFNRPGIRRFLGSALIAPYLRFVKATSRVVIEPADYWQRLSADGPVILISWHGQSNLAYVLMPERNFAILVSNHPDGQIMAGLASTFGYRVVAGSGASTRQRTGTGGLSGFRTMVKALGDGFHVFATGDVPPEPGRHVSRGIVALARLSGRPVYTMATASSRRKVLDRVWDKMQFNLPFSRVSMVIEGPFDMSEAAGPEAGHLAALAQSLDRVLEGAIALADSAP